VRAESSVRTSVLFPGPNWLRTNLWEAWRWRPDDYAKTVPRQTPYPSLDQLEQIMAERGIELEWTPLEEVADTVVRGDSVVDCFPLRGRTLCQHMLRSLRLVVLRVLATRACSRPLEGSQPTAPRRH